MFFKKGKAKTAAVQMPSASGDIKQLERAWSQTAAQIKTMQQTLAGITKAVGTTASFHPTTFCYWSSILSRGALIIMRIPVIMHLGVEVNGGVEGGPKE